ncbi:PilZ domain-containing protein [Phycisphaerales bacterium AB-hyl4]|uniref:PilZ domain-containing protein n=1 Tax=Natronomicrosphaera hydrolytica TaxID=3242702 RepID=A0ABV4U5R0_9BACT
MPEVATERRADRRIRTACPVKLRCDRTGVRYIAGWSRDVSAGGTLIELASSVSLKPGDRVSLGLALTPRQALIRSGQVVEAVVVRSLRHEARQHLALRFTQRQRLARAG